MASQPEGSPVTPTPRQRLGVERPFALNPPVLAFGAANAHPYRFSDYDEGAFSESSGVSAEQAKRALRAHLAETERRMGEAGRLGTALVQQQRDLTEKLREVEELQAESELSPELKKKLAELEKEYDDVARETARAFLPKQRIPSNESTGSPEGKGGRRSMSPVKYESHSSASPSKFHVSNRKQRNQATNRVHDIEFAAEISTSLISQVRGLQALLSEREEELRDAKQNVTQLEDHNVHLRDHIKELGESEHRYKEENWNLETRIHEFQAAQRDAADKDKKVAQQLAVLLSDKAKAQRELDELRASHARLVDDHAAAVKKHDIELGTAKRNMVMADTDKAALQRKIDDLASQNQELARAVSMQHRARGVESNAVPATSEDDFDTAADNVTPEHSPPASPVKGTPRHSILETETLKTSLLHSQRMLQSLRTNLHREKTEKLELRRLLHDARDELERVRADPGSSSVTKKSRRDARDNHSRLRPSQLGGARTSRTDLYMLASADPDWEEDDGVGSPSSTKPTAVSNDTSDHFDTANEAQLSDTSFATARDGAETADDFHTTAEDLSGDDTMTETEKDTTRRRTLTAKSGALAASTNEDYDPANQSTASTSDDDDYNAPRTPTASIPGSSGGVSRMRVRASRSSLASRRLRHMSSVEEANSPGGLQSSPFSGAGSPATLQTPGSSSSTPRFGAPQQSLFAELGELDEDSDEEVASDGTTSRYQSPRIVIPASSAGSNSGRSSVAHSPVGQAGHSSRIVMVDRSTLTSSVTITPWTEDEEKSESAKLGVHGQTTSRPASVISFTSENMDETLKEFPSPPSSPPKYSAIISPVVLFPPSAETSTRSMDIPSEPEPLPHFTMSEVFSVPIEPVAEPTLPPPSPVLLALSTVQSEHVRSIAPPSPVVPAFVSSALHTVDIEPIELPPPVVPALSFSSVEQQSVQPIAELIPAPPAPEPLSLSHFHIQHVVPVAEPEPEVTRAAPIPVPVPVPVSIPTLEPLSFSTVQAQAVQPVDVPEPEVVREIAAAPEPLSFSAVQIQHVEPIAEPEPVVMEAAVPAREPLSFSSFEIQHVEPIAEPEPVVVEAAVPAREPLSFSSVEIQHVEPIAEPEPVVPEVVIPEPEPLTVSGFQILDVEPIPEPSKPLPAFSISKVHAQGAMPIATPDVPPPAMTVSSVFSQGVQPVIVEEPEEVAPAAVVASTEVQTDAWNPEPSVSTTGALGALGAAAAGAGIVASSTRRSVTDIDDDMVPRSPKRNGFVMPKDFAPITGLESSLQSTPKKSAASKAGAPSTPVITKHGTGQGPSDSMIPETPTSPRLFKEISNNGGRLGRQTEDKIAPSTPSSVIRDESFVPRLNGNAPLMHARAESQDSTPGTIIRTAQAGETPVRPGSSSSNRHLSNAFVVPPLPPNHREVIEAARTGSAGSMAMGETAHPPTWRAHTPSSVREPVFTIQGATPTPKANTRGTVANDARPPSRLSSQAPASQHGGLAGTLSRQTSMSSFVSEVDARFNVPDGSDVFGTGNHTDPRMIQAITQTMIGEYLWKYTRKTGRSGLSENRHRRYFWIHPYTRMLYWSDNGPTAGSRSEQRAKSIVIESVRVVTDDNPMPPGLHRKSLIVTSPGRTIKFTCTTGHRHEIWFNALSYLLIRSDEIPDDSTAADSEHITREDVEEFNPSFGRRSAAQPRRPPVSLASYASRATRTESPAFDISMNVPTLRATPKTPKKNINATAGTPSTSAAALSSRRRLSRIGSYWRSSNSLSAQFNSLRGRSSALSNRQPINGANGTSIYETSEVNDSAEELRAMYEAQDRAADRLENVRACCDGKHDVGMLHHHSKRHRHSQGVSSVMSTPTHSMRSRA